MDTAGWRVFTAMAERESVSEAAGQLNLSQSGASHALKALEERIGVSLFTRHRRGVALTPAGRELLPLAYDLLRQEEKLKQGIARVKGLTQGSIRIGACSSVASTWLPDVLISFRERFPTIEVEILEGADTGIEERLRDNSLDCAVTGKRSRPGFEWIELERDRFWAVSKRPQDSAEEPGQREPLKLNALETEPFIALSEYYDHDMNAILARLGVRPRNVVCRSSDDRAVVAMAQRGIGTAIVSERVFESCGGDRRCLRPIDPPAARHIGIAVRSLADASPAARAFIHMVCSYKGKPTGTSPRSCE